MLAALEERLSARLIERTTRRMWLMEAGCDYQQRCSALLAEMAEAHAAASELSLLPRGMLLVTCSVSLALLHIAPWLSEFRLRYPDPLVEIVIANHYPNFIDVGIDLAVRIREQEGDFGITVQRLAQTSRVLAASPAYLARHGRPSSPDDLVRHEFLVGSLAVDPYVLHLERNGARRELPITAAFEANEGQVICAAGRAGMGVVVQPFYLIHDDVVAGRFVPLLEDWRLSLLTINLAYQSRRHLPSKIREVAEAIREYVRSSNLGAHWNAV